MEEFYFFAFFAILKSIFCHWQKYLKNENIKKKTLINDANDNKCRPSSNPSQKYENTLSIKFLIALCSIRKERVFVSRCACYNPVNLPSMFCHRRIFSFQNVKSELQRHNSRKRHLFQ